MDTNSVPFGAKRIAAVVVGRAAQGRPVQDDLLVREDPSALREAGDAVPRPAGCPEMAHVPDDAMRRV
jgi:hypothetical protein